MSDRSDCAHPDVRYCPDERGAIACFVCGRLFGHLRSNGYFTAHNPTALATSREQQR